MGTETLIVGAVDAIELSEGFFGYTEKYTLKSSQIHVLARSSQQKAEKFGNQERLINSGFYDLATVYQSVHVNY